MLPVEHDYDRLGKVITTSMIGASLNIAIITPLLRKWIGNLTENVLPIETTFRLGDLKMKPYWE